MSNPQSHRPTTYQLINRMRKAQAERLQMSPNPSKNYEWSILAIQREWVANFGYMPLEEHIEAIREVPKICPECKELTEIILSERGGRFSVKCDCGQTQEIDALIIGGDRYAQVKTKLHEIEEG